MVLIRSVEKVHRDLISQGFNYRIEAVFRMFERFRIQGERQFPVSSYRAA